MSGVAKTIEQIVWGGQTLIWRKKLYRGIKIVKGSYGERWSHKVFISSNSQIAGSAGQERIIILFYRDGYVFFDQGVLSGYSHRINNSIGRMIRKNCFYLRCNLWQFKDVIKPEVNLPESIKNTESLQTYLERNFINDR